MCSNNYIVYMKSFSSLKIVNMCTQNHLVPLNNQFAHLEYWKSPLYTSVKIRFLRGKIGSKQVSVSCRIRNVIFQICCCTLSCNHPHLGDCSLEGKLLQGTSVGAHDRNHHHHDVRAGPVLGKVYHYFEAVLFIGRDWGQCTCNVKYHLTERCSRS